MLKILMVQPILDEPHGIFDFRRKKLPPLGLMFLAAVTRRTGHKVKIVDRMVDGLNIRKILEEFRPHVVATTSMTGYMILDAIKISKDVKAFNKNIPVVWGGVHVSLLPEQTLKEEFIDYAVIGEGEETFLELLQYLEHGKKRLDKIKGLAYKKRGKVVLNERREFIKNLDDIPFLPWDLVNTDEYFKDNEVSLFTSRGCPHRCSFCYQEKIHRRVWRAQSAERVLKEIKRVQKITKIDRLKFLDDNVSTNKQRLYKILDGLPKDIRLYIESRVDYMDDEFIQKMKMFKDVQILIGVEAGYESMLKRIKKDISLDTFRKVFKKLNENNIATNASVIIGYPDETIEDAKRTVEFLKSLNPTIHHVNIYMPFPGSQLYDECIEKGLFVPPKKLEDWAYISSEMNAKTNVSQASSEELEKLRSGVAWATLLTYIKKKRFWDLYKKIIKYIPKYIFKEKIVKKIFKN